MSRTRWLRRRSVSVTAGCAAIFAASLAPAARAGLPSYSIFELQARSNIIDGYNLAAGSTFNSATPDLNDAGTVTFRLILDGATGNSALWYGAAGAGSAVHQATDDFLISDPFIDDLGRVSFEEFDFGVTHGVFVYDPLAGVASVAVPPGGPLGLQGFTDPQINDAGQIGFRADLGGPQSWSADVSGAQSHYALEGAGGIGYLFSPRFDGTGGLAGKVRLGGLENSRPDEIRRYASDGSYTTLAVDRDSDPGSAFLGFDNGIGLSEDGRAAFVANIDGGRGVYLAHGGSVVPIATTLDPQISGIDFFGPDVNEEGWVVFRAFDGSGLRAIFVGDGVALRRVIGEHDLVPSDLGQARIDQHDTSPVFGGSVAINAGGDVVFHAALTPSADNQIEWGSGIFVAYAATPAEVPPVTDAGDPAGGEATLLEARVFPNPSAKQARITVSLARPAHVGAAIFDARGRRVRQIGPFGFAGGEQTLTWDGLDDEGREAPLGTYWVRVESLSDSGPESRTKTLIRLR